MVCRTDTPRDMFYCNFQLIESHRAHGVAHREPGTSELPVTKAFMVFTELPG